jgi:hypothetical protein
MGEAAPGMEQTMPPQQVIRAVSTFPTAAPVDHAPLLCEGGGLRGAQQPLSVHKVLELVVPLGQAAAQGVAPCGGVGRHGQQLPPAVEAAGQQHVLPPQLSG